MKVHTVPCLKDNYSFLIENENKEAVAIDAPEFGPIDDFVCSADISLRAILITHHHHDHIGGLESLKNKYPCKIMGWKGDVHRISGMDRGFDDSEEFEILGLKFRVIYTPGHTFGHVLYYLEKEKILFTGDTLFSLGCGRLFEGTHEQMFMSLEKIKSLPDEVLVYCGHEYTQANGKFALSVDPDNSDLKKRIAEVKELLLESGSTIPVTLGMEKKTNPFLRTKTREEFGRLRDLKDYF